MKEYLLFLYDAGRGRVGKWWITFVIFLLLNMIVYFMGMRVNFLSLEAVMMYLASLFLMANFEFFFFRKK